MFIVSLIFFYSFPASMLFIHGLGLERLSMNVRSSRVILPFLLKAALVMLCAASISWVLSLYFFPLLRLSFLMPVCSLLIAYGCEQGISLIMPDHAVNETGLMGERIFIGGTVLFALYHAFNYAELVVIVLCSVLTLGVWSFVLYAIKRRVDESSMSAQWKNAPLLLISLGVVALALYAWDMVWV
ncbi:MAG: hypothetical protein ACTTI6_05880 [Treponema sp.]|uniref:hypothetical protein n=1 Tax=Treponema sp. TaxID=166 RepID=UPI003FA31956